MENIWKFRPIEVFLKQSKTHSILITEINFAFLSANINLELE